MTWNDDTPLFARRGDKVVGPNPWSRLRDLHRAGKILPSDEIAPAPHGPWQTLAAALERHGPASDRPATPDETAPLPAPAAAAPATRSRSRRALWLAPLAGCLLLGGIFLGQRRLLPRRAPGPAPATAPVATTDHGEAPFAAVKPVGEPGIEPVGEPVGDAAGSDAPRPVAADEPIVPPAEPETNRSAPPGRELPPIPADYATLARMISGPYALPGTGPTKMEPGELRRVLVQTAASDHAATRAAAEPLLAAGRAVRDAVQTGAAVSDQSRQDLLDALWGSLRGDFSREVEREFRTSSGDLLFQTETVDDSADELFSAFAAGALSQARENARLQEAIAAFNRAMTDAWRTLEPRLPEIYAGRPEVPQAVVITIEPPTAPDGSGGAFRLRHRADRTLHDVTVVLAMVHFSAAPEVYSRQTLFIPEWEAGQAVDLPTMLQRNCPTEEYRQGRPYAARLPGLDPWLDGAGGVVAVDFSAWAAEGAQPSTLVHFPEAARAGARWELESVERVLFRATAEGTKRDPAFRLTALPDPWCQRALERVDRLAPPGDPVGESAALARRDPARFLDQARQIQAGQLARLAEPDSVFVLQLDGLAPSGGGQPGDENGRLALRFARVNPDSGQVAATLFAPGDGDNARRLDGTLGRDHFGRWVATFGFPRRTGATTDRLGVTAALLTGGGRIEVAHCGNTWAGRLALGADRVGAVRLIPSEDPDLRRTSRALAEAEPKPEEVAALAATLQPGRTWKGTWKAVSDRDVTRESPFNGFPQAFQGGPPGGPLTLEIQELDAPSGALRAALTAPQPAPPQRRGQRLPGLGPMRFGSGGRSVGERRGTLEQDPRTRAWTLVLRSGGVERMFTPLQLNPETSSGLLTLRLEGSALRGRMEVPGANGKMWVEIELKD